MPKKKFFIEALEQRIMLDGAGASTFLDIVDESNKEKVSTKNSTEIAKLTLKCLKENVPNEVPGIAFLSGGQTEIEATQNLNEINKINDTNFLMSFSYGRALQQSALKNWGKNIKDIDNTQKIFNHRSKMNGLSTSAKWSLDLEKQVTA